MILNLCVNYGGQVEIVDAAKGIARRPGGEAAAATRSMPEMFAGYLYVPDIPPVDLLIRPGGDLRVSNFMLWQIAYAEFYVDDEVLAGLPAGGPGCRNRGVREASATIRRPGARRVADSKELRARGAV
jgi:hypothetical protein